MDSAKNKQFLALYDDLADPIFRHCYFRIGDRERAKDLVQEVFMKAWRYLVSEKEIKYGKALLYKIANNLIIDESRRHAASSLDDLQEKGFDIGEDHQRRLEARLCSDSVFEFLNKEEIANRDLLVMRFIDDLSVKEIAEIIGEKENVISVRIHRCLDKVKQFYGKNGKN